MVASNDAERQALRGVPWFRNSSRAVWMEQVRVRKQKASQDVWP